MSASGGANVTETDNRANTESGSKGFTMIELDEIARQAEDVSNPGAAQIGDQEITQRHA